MAINETMQPFQFGREKSYYGSCGINIENVIMYPRWRLTVQNTSGVKIYQLAKIWEEMKVFVKIWEGSITSFGCYNNS